jgi:hypothetical protein
LESRKLVTATLLGVIVFLIKGPLLAPYADFLVIFEAMLVAIGFALLGRGGATYVELVNGVLLTIYEASAEPALAPFVLPLALIFGMLIDLAATFFSARIGSDIRPRRLIAAVTVSSTLTGLIAYVVTVPTLISLNLLPNDASMDLILGLVVVAVGIVEGAAGGYLAARTWERSLKARFKSVQPSVS